MEKKIAPSEQKAQALRALLQGQAEGQSGVNPNKGMKSLMAIPITPCAV
jgi:hypothetical protein